MLHSIISIAKAIPEKYKLDLIGDVLVVYEGVNLKEIYDVPDNWYIRATILDIIDNRDKPREYTIEELLNV